MSDPSSIEALSIAKAKPKKRNGNDAHKENLTMPPSISILSHVLLGIFFFFAIIGVFGLWFAIDALVLAVLICVYVFLKRPEGEEA